MTLTTILFMNGGVGLEWLLSKGEDLKALLPIVFVILYPILLPLTIAGVIINILYLLNIANTFKAISPKNRRMSPDSVWLMLIPFFNIVWHFIIVNRMTESLKLEFAERNITVSEEQPGKDIGLAYCILSCCNFIPYLNFLTAIPSLVCWIIYWVKIYGYKKMLQQSNINSMNSVNF